MARRLAAVALGIVAAVILVAALVYLTGAYIQHPWCNIIGTCNA